MTHKNPFCVKFRLTEIEYDVKVRAVAAAKIAFHDAPADLRNDVVAAATQQDMLDRVIKSSLSKVRDMLRFAVIPSSRMTSDEIIDSDTEYSIPLLFDDEWKGEPDVLCDAIHDYIVSSILRQWARMTGQREDAYAIDETEGIERIHDIACKYVL